MLQMSSVDLRYGMGLQVCHILLQFCTGRNWCKLHMDIDTVTCCFLLTGDPCARPGAGGAGPVTWSSVCKLMVPL